MTIADLRRIFDRSSTTRFVSRLLLGLFVVYALYLVVANVVLKTRLLRSAVNSEDSVHLGYASATSWWFGRVHVEGMRLRIEDRVVQAELELAKADVRIGLLDLIFSQTFHATRVRGEGVRFAMRGRVPTVNVDNALRVAAFPVIEGVDLLPLAKAGPPQSDEMSTAGKKPWTIHLEDIEVDTDELWILEYRYRGKATAKGAFRLEPKRKLWVGPASVELVGGSLSVHPHVIATDVKGSIDARIHEFDVVATKGAKPLEFIEARMRLSSTLAHSQFLNSYFASPAFSNGKGRLELDAKFNRGVFEEGTTANLDVADVSVRHGQLAMRGTHSFSVRVPKNGILNIGGDAAAVEVSAVTPSGEKKVARAVGSTVRLEVGASNVAEGGKLNTASAKSSVEISDLDELVGALGPKIFTAGAGKVDFEASFADDRWAAAYATELRDARFQIGVAASAALDGKVSGKARADRDFEKMFFDDLRVDVSRFTAKGHGQSRTTWVSGRIPRLAIVGDPPCAALSTDVAIGSAGVIGAIVDVGMLQSFAAELLADRRLDARARVRVLDTNARVDFDRVTVAGTEGKGIWVKTKGPPSAVFTVDGGAISAGIDVNAGSVKVKPLASLDWFDERRGAVARTGPECVDAMRALSAQ